MVPPHSHRVSRVRRYSGYCSLIRSFAYRTLTFFGLLSHTIQLDFMNTKCSPNPKGISTSGLASSAFARHYLRNLGWFLFLALLRCFSSGGSPRIPIWFSIRYWSIAPVGCPIRKSTDIATIYVSPWLIAVNHVLHRLPVPRHSPCALYSLTFFVLCNPHRDTDSFVNSLQQNCNCYPIYLFVLWLFQRRYHSTNPIFSRLSLHSFLCSVFKVRI